MARGVCMLVGAKGWPLSCCPHLVTLPFCHSLWFVLFFCRSSGRGENKNDSISEMKRSHRSSLQVFGPEVAEHLKQKLITTAILS